MKLDRYQMAAVKKTAGIIKPLLNKRAKLIEKRDALNVELFDIDRKIELWEKPIIEMTGGYTSSQALECNGDLPEPTFEEGDNIAEAIAEDNTEMVY